MQLSIYQIFHPQKPDKGAQYRAVPYIDGKENIALVILGCIKKAKQFATDNNLKYEEMIHKMNGRIINENEILQLC